MDLAPHCIYTMRHSDRLAEELAQGGRGALIENKYWATGERLFREYERSGLRMPIVFSAAEADLGGLIYWGLITRVEAEPSDEGEDRRPRTACEYEQLKKIDPPRPPSALVLRSTGKALSDDFIRPYAICRTPSFIVGECRSR